MKKAENKDSIIKKKDSTYKKHFGIFKDLVKKQDKKEHKKKQKHKITKDTNNNTEEETLESFSKQSFKTYSHQKSLEAQKNIFQRKNIKSFEKSK